MHLQTNQEIFLLNYFARARSFRACLKNSPKKSITFDPVLSPADHNLIQSLDKRIESQGRGPLGILLSWVVFLLSPLTRQRRYNLPYRCINNTSDYTLNGLDKGFALIVVTIIRSNCWWHPMKTFYFAVSFTFQESR